MKRTAAFIVSAPASGTGKTTVTMGLIAALRRRGLIVQPFKSGPDYIDSAYHSRLAGRPCINLDTWMMPAPFIRETFLRHAHGAEVVIVEGVMGLFDGAADGTGSTAHLAKLLNLPVLHVIHAATSAQTAAAVLYGLEQFDPEVQSLGAIFNTIAGPSHLESITATAGKKCRGPVFGSLPRDPELALPERQLGLVSAFEHGLPPDYVEKLATAIERHIRLDALLAAAPASAGAVPSPHPVCPRPAVRLGVARDESFCFYYQDNLDLLRAAGIEPVFFSPLHETALPENLAGLYFGGGFPEEFAIKLSENQTMLQAVRHFKGPVLAECGGLIYLCEEFLAADGSRHPLAGLVPGRIQMTGTLQGFGYREVVFNRDTILGPAGTVLRGHEFHWSRWIQEPDASHCVFRTGNQIWGYYDGTVLASYFHAHFGSNPAVVQHFYRALTSSGTQE